jgi:hypothetical protein
MRSAKNGALDADVRAVGSNQIRGERVMRPTATAARLTGARQFGGRHARRGRFVPADRQPESIVCRVEYTLRAVGVFVSELFQHEREHVNHVPVPVLF